MKIGIDIRNIGKQRTGSEVVVLELTKNILKIDRENEYLLLTDTDEKSVLDYVRKNLELEGKSNVKVVSLKAKNKFIWAGWTMPIFMRKNRLDIFHTEYILPFFIPKDIKVVTHIHDVSFKVYRDMIMKKDLFFLDLLIPKSIKRADKIVAVSQFTKDEILRYYGTNEKKVGVIYNSINIKDVEVNEHKARFLRKKYGLPEKFILYLGTLQPRKNIPILIRAYAEIKNKIPDIKLVIAGDKKAHNFDDKIDDAINRYKLTGEDITFCGFISEEDKSVIYSISTVFIFPSLYEGFGIPILEAMSRRVAVLASDIPPHREVAGDAALYFDPYSLDDLKKKLYNICVDENLRNRLIGLENARVNFFSWEKSAKKLLEIYKSLK
ncbi:MAG: glycosyltransferase family 1 protein [Candidatus Moranbacteria bacterium]|nr:glycosyltransferase family 1 protein [Candidatus Moranbacteria bacterium]